MPAATTMNKSNAALAAQQNALRNAIDGGSGAGKLKIYDGTKPANANTAVTVQNVLASFTLPKPSAPDASNGVLTLNPIPAVVATHTGTATWARLTDSAGNVIGDFDVDDAGTPAILLDSQSIVVGGGVTINSFTITEV